MYTAFGSAVHAVPEYAYEEDTYKEEGVEEEFPIAFLAAFENELEELKETGYFDSEDFKIMLERASKYQKKDVTKEMLIEEFQNMGIHISKWVIPEMTKKFGNFKVLGIEEKVCEPVPGYPDYDYLGYIDFVIETEDGKIVIIDWKTASWGWASGYNTTTRRQNKKSDKFVSYQLTFYKHFYMEKHKLQDRHKDIETYFVLMKRAPGKDKEGALKNPIEFYRVTSGLKKIENALNYLRRFVYNLSNKRYYKNRKHCTKFKGYDPCVFRHTKHCK